MNIDLSKVLEWLNSLYGMPKVALVFFLCVGLAVLINYVIQRVPFIPNYMVKVAVPCVLPMLGALALPLCSHWEKSSIPTVWQFIAINMVVGVITGIAAWLVFMLILYKRLCQAGLNGGSDPNAFTKPEVPKL